MPYNGEKVEKSYWSLAAEKNFIDHLGEHRRAGFRSISLLELLDNYIEATTARTESWAGQAVAHALQRRADIASGASYFTDSRSPK